MPAKGVNLHCALCDDVLFTTPLDLAAGLLDVVAESTAESSAYALACRIQSAVCIAAANERMDPRSEMVYEKLQEVLRNLRDGRSGRSSPLKEFLGAVLKNMVDILWYLYKIVKNKFVFDFSVSSSFLMIPFVLAIFKYPEIFEIGAGHQVANSYPFAYQISTGAVLWMWLSGLNDANTASHSIIQCNASFWWFGCLEHCGGVEKCMPDLSNEIRFFFFGWWFGKSFSFGKLNRKSCINACFWFFIIVSHWLWSSIIPSECFRITKSDWSFKRLKNMFSSRLKPTIFSPRPRSYLKDDA